MKEFRTSFFSSFRLKGEIGLCLQGREWLEKPNLHNRRATLCGSKVAQTTACKAEQHRTKYRKPLALRLLKIKAHSGCEVQTKIYLQLFCRYKNNLYFCSVFLCAKIHSNIFLFFQEKRLQFSYRFKISYSRLSWGLLF